MINWIRLTANKIFTWSDPKSPIIECTVSKGRMVKIVFIHTRFGDGIFCVIRIYYPIQSI